MSILFTRQNLIPGVKAAKKTPSLDTSDSGRQIYALIPGWDLFNHRDNLPVR
jgi:hypothetical protein